MLYFDRIGISEGTDVNKTNKSKECHIFHYWYFLDKGFKFQRDVCNLCHNVLMISMSLSNTAILNIKGVDYCCIINLIWKSKAVNLLQKADLKERSKTL